MLKKLIKHEFIASYRTYIPVYAAIYILSVLLSISYQVQARFLSGLLIMLFSLMLGAMGVFTIYNLVISLWSRVYGKPGYLLFSVPAKTSEIFISKFVVNFIWVLASVFVTVTALSISFSVLGVLSDVRSILRGVWMILDFSNMSIFMFIVYGIVMIIYYIAFFMCLFALLNLLYKGEHKILMGVLFYFVLSVILRLISNSFSISFASMFVDSNVLNFNVIWLITAIYLVLAALLTSLAYYAINKKLELQ